MKQQAGESFNIITSDCNTIDVLGSSVTLFGRKVLPYLTFMTVMQINGSLERPVVILRMLLVEFIA